MVEKFDVVVYGATSFAGKILCRYLLDMFGVDGALKWTIAGRSKNKLKELKSKLGVKRECLQEIIAEANNYDSLQSMCKQSRVIVSTVGPYALYGEFLIRACAELGSDYCDLTGEAQWVRKMILKYENSAKSSGARIINCCGFDSVPSDLGVHFLQSQANKRFGKHCSKIQMRVRSLSGGISGGTFASIINTLKEAAINKNLRKELADPYSLCPKVHGFSSRQTRFYGLSYDKNFGVFIAPFIMSAINEKIVHRSNCLKNNYYGDNFEYDEAMITGKNLKGIIYGASFSLALTGFLVAASIKPVRLIIEKYLLPKPGEGPSHKSQKNGFYDLRFQGVSDSGDVIKTKVTGDQDPGYGSTAKILGQAAACLALDTYKASHQGGFYTPSSILGDRLIERLTKYSGLTFKVI